MISKMKCPIRRPNLQIQRSQYVAGRSNATEVIEGNMNTQSPSHATNSSMPQNRVLHWYVNGGYTRAGNSQSLRVCQLKQNDGSVVGSNFVQSKLPGAAAHDPRSARASVATMAKDIDVKSFVVNSQRPAAAAVKLPVDIPVKPKIRRTRPYYPRGKRILRKNANTSMSEKKCQRLIFKGTLSSRFHPETQGEPELLIRIPHDRAVDLDRIVRNYVQNASKNKWTIRD